MFATRPKEEKEGLDMSLGMGLMIGTAIEFQNTIINLIKEYNSKDIEVIPITVLEQAIMEASMKTLSPEGLVGSAIVSNYSKKEKEAEECK